jgi:hypothetical protein
MLGLAGRDAPVFARYLQAVLAGGGDDARLIDATTVEVPRPRILDAEGGGSEAARFAAWNGLFEGALALHNRHLRLETETGGPWRWHIRGE